MSRRLSFRVAVALFFILAGTSFAWAKKVQPAKKARVVTAVVLPLKAKGFDRKEAASLGQAMGTALVRELKALGIFRVLVGKDVSAKIKQLRQKKVMAPMCMTKKPCVRAVGNSFKAKVIFQLRMAKAEGGVTLTLRAYDVQSGKEVRKAVELTSGEPADVERAARWAARTASSPMITTLLKGKGRLEVACDQAGADLYLNGKSYGKRTNKSFKVSAGVFDVQVKKEGFEPFHDVLVVKPGQNQKVSAALKSVDRPAPAVVAERPDDLDGDVPEPPGKGPDAKPEPKPDLPAWAIFEKKPKPEEQPGPGSPKGPLPPPVAASVSTTAAPKVGPKSEPAPFIPSGKRVPDEPIEKIDAEGPGWYQTWWFWTIVGVAVAGGVTGGLYAGGLFDGGSSVPTGAALISWQ